MRVRTRALLSLVGLLLVGCGSPGDQAATSSVSEDRTKTTTTMGSSTISEEAMPEQSSVVDDAIADLAARLGVDPSAIELVKVNAVQWPDGALGCPDDGVVYTQAVVEGFQVLLSANGRVFDYHSAEDGDVFLCRSDEKDGGRDFVPPPGIDT